MTVTTTDSSIIVFARAPVTGQVKTRLATHLDPAIIVELYRNFVRDIIDTITGSGYGVSIFYDPPGYESMMRAWLGNCHAFFAQRGDNLGQKMENAFHTIFENGVRRAVLMGTDVPNLPAKIVSDAISSLTTYDAVIGPATDGGYYLIGFREKTFFPGVFRDMPWSTSDVYQKTMRAFAWSKTTVRQLPIWRDVDMYDDLMDLIQSLSQYPGQAEHTYSYLKSIGMIEK